MTVSSEKSPRQKAEARGPPEHHVRKSSCKGENQTSGVTVRSHVASKEAGLQDNARLPWSLPPPPS